MARSKSGKAKKHYEVYWVQTGHGCYGSSEKYVGDTWAVSPAQACNNIRFRFNGSSGYFVYDRLDEGFVYCDFEAREVSN